MNNLVFAVPVIGFATLATSRLIAESEICEPLRRWITVLLAEREARFKAWWPTVPLEAQLCRFCASWWHSALFSLVAWSALDLRPLELILLCPAAVGFADLMARWTKENP